MAIDPRRQPVREYEEILDVEVQLDETSKILAGMQLEDKLAELDVIEANFAELRKQHKERVGGVWDEIRKLRVQVRSGTRMEPMKVKRLMDHRTGKVVVRRADTGTVLEERAMTNEEKQVDLL